MTREDKITYLRGLAASADRCGNMALVRAEAKEAAGLDASGDRADAKNHADHAGAYIDLAMRLACQKEDDHA